MRASNFWIQLKGEPAINPRHIIAVDIIVNNTFNVIFIGGDHFEIKSNTLEQAQRKRNKILLKVAKVVMHSDTLTSP